MSFTDTIKKSVLEGFTANDLTTTSIAVTLGMAVLLGLYIYGIYRVTTKNSFYNRSFNKALAILPLIVAGILLAMQSNLIISLGMVGALSIVRFRNAVKDSMDLVYLFWSISVGIITGAGLYELSVISSLAITLLVILLDMMPALKAPYLLVVSMSEEGSDEKLSECVKKYAPRFKIKSHNITPTGTEIIFEIYASKGEGLMKDVAALAGVNSVNLLSHDGEIRL